MAGGSRKGSNRFGKSVKSTEDVYGVDDDSNHAAMDLQRQRRLGSGTVTALDGPMKNLQIKEKQKRSGTSNLGKGKKRQEAYDEDDEEEEDVEEEEEEEDVDVTQEILAESGYSKVDTRQLSLLLDTPVKRNMHEETDEDDDEEDEDEEDIDAEIMAQSGYSKTKSHSSPSASWEKKNMWRKPYDDTEEEEEDELDLTAEILAQSGYFKAGPLHTPEVSLRPNVNLVSAMKGSRERMGVQSEEKTVTWAADVYTPKPSSPSNFVRSRTQRTRSEKKAIERSRQKGGVKASVAIAAAEAGGAAKGKCKSKGKDKEKDREKRQGRKYAGTSKRCFGAPDND